MYAKHDVTFTLGSNTKGRKIRNKLDEDKTKNTPFKLATGYSVNTDS